MALRPRSANLPLGQFDVLNTDMANITGGEVVTFTKVARAQTSTETSAADVLDGYLYDDTVPRQNRPALTLAATAAQFPLMLADDGIAGYGTLFGSVIGVGTGQSTVGTQIGPHTAAASGKLTAWDKPGLYAISTTSLAADFVATIPAGGLTPGQVLGFSATGKLCHSACSTAVASTGVGNFVEFEPSNTSLVTTSSVTAGST